jgi:Outer membrane protein beta-barrel domain
MKKLALTLLVVCSFGLLAYAGPERLSSKDMSKEMAAAPPPCPEWYADNEWNVSLWGAYAFTGTESARSSIEDADDSNIFGTYDRFLGGDHAWGGGLDAKYFFRRYFGVGVEGFALAGRGTHARFDSGPNSVEEEFYENHDHTVGGALGTFTLRYPFHCSRFAPYAWAGGGGVFGGFNDRTFVSGSESRVAIDEQSRFVGQFGGGLEIRITPHIGVTGDFSWNVLDGPNNNFGMFRSGVNFAF